MVLDLIYDRTKLLQAAEAAGAATSDGELMLLHQGAAAFRLWSGQEAPLDVMQAALEKARKQGAALGGGRADRRGRAWRPRARGRIARRHGTVPVPDRRGEPWPEPGCHDRGRPGRPVADG